MHSLWLMKEFDRAEMSLLVSLYEMNAKYADVIALEEAIENINGLLGQQ